MIIALHIVLGYVIQQHEIFFCLVFQFCVLERICLHLCLCIS